MDLKAACLAILAELEREFYAVRTFTELLQRTGLQQSQVEAALSELQARQLVDKKGFKNGRRGYQRIYVTNAKPLD